MNTDFNLEELVGKTSFEASMVLKEAIQELPAAEGDSDQRSRIFLLLGITVGLFARERFQLEYELEKSDAALKESLARLEQITGETP